MYPQSVSAVPSPVSSHSCNPVIVNYYQPLSTSSASSQWCRYTLGLLGAISSITLAPAPALLPPSTPAMTIGIQPRWAIGLTWVRHCTAFSTDLRGSIWLHGGPLQLSPWCPLFIFFYGFSLQRRPLEHSSGCALGYPVQGHPLDLSTTCTTSPGSSSYSSNSTQFVNYPCLHVYLSCSVSVCCCRVSVTA